MKRKILQVIEVQTLPDGSVQLVLKNGQALIVHRVGVVYSAAHLESAPSTGSRPGHIHTLCANEVPEVGSNITF